MERSDCLDVGEGEMGEIILQWILGIKIIKLREKAKLQYQFVMGGIDESCLLECCLLDLDSELDLGIAWTLFVRIGDLVIQFMDFLPLLQKRPEEDWIF
jgi:hypothetical protein